MAKYLFGLDLSMEQTGLTVFDMETLKPVYINSIKTKDKDTHGMRLYRIVEFFHMVMKMYPPSQVAIERGFSRFNTSTQVIYRVHGVCNYTFKDYEQKYYSPKEVKETICRGDATKKYVRETIEKMYQDVNFQNEDESDSFAVAMTYLIKNKLLQWDKTEVKKIRKKKSKEVQN